MANKTNFSGFDMSSEKKRNRNAILDLLIHKSGVLLWFLFGAYIWYLGFELTESDITHSHLLRIFTILVTIGFTGLVYYFILVPRFNSLKSRIPWTVLTLISVYVISYLLGDYLVYAVKIIVGTICILTAIIVYLNLIRQIIDHSGFIRSFIVGSLYLFIGLDLFFFIDPKDTDFFYILGIYTYLLAGSFAFQSLSSLFTFRKKRKEKRRRITSLPFIISAFLPIGFFANINKKVSDIEAPENKDLFYEKTTDLEEKEEDQKNNELVIYIHTRAGLIPGFGHVDIAFKDKVYCFGNYDQNTWFLGGFLSSGVLALSNPENHINHALNNDKKILVAYTLKISEKTQKKIEKKIEKIMKKSYRWKSQAELADEGEIEGAPEDYDDVASLMYLGEEAEFYKFKKGSPYRTYYLLGQNCAMFANDLVGSSGIRLVRLNRIVTPGTYLEYLNELYSMRHTIVVDRKIYMLNNEGKPYLLTEENEKELEQKVK